MTLADWVLIANLVTVVVAAVAIWVSVRGLNGQMQMTTFIEYTSRFSRIASSLPFDARQPGSTFTPASLTKREYESFLSTYREYFNLCWEEWWLYGQERIDPETWGVWKDCMRQTMAFPGAVHAWNELESEYKSDPNFFGFFKGKILAAISD
jgi:hypothetical protein